MTPLWTADALRAATGGRMTRPFDVTGISIDTRTLRPGDLFVALQGTRDGHAHVPDALATGAAGVIVSNPGCLPDGAPALIVDDTLAGLHALGRAGRVRFGGRVLAVTGSVGKTTVKEMLRTALSAFGVTHAAEASYNNHWGVPLTLARLPANAAWCVAEIGMNNPGEILPLARMAEPHVAIITAIGSAHIGHMGSLEAIAEEKASILHGQARNGISVLPREFAFFDRLAVHAAHEILTFGLGPTADVRALSTTPNADSTHLIADVGGTMVDVDLRAPGTHMVVNALAALAACHALALDPTMAAEALAGFRPGAGRGLQRRLPGDVLLLDESYNASTASVRAALEVLALLPATRRIAVLGDMLELGDFAESEHAGLAPDVARTSDLLYACGPLTRVLFDRIPAAQRGAHAADAETLAPLVAAALRPGNAVLVKGSLGSRMRVVVSALDRPDAPSPPGGPG